MMMRIYEVRQATTNGEKKRNHGAKKPQNSLAFYSTAIMQNTTQLSIVGVLSLNKVIGY
jgi:hypothetical protein